MINVSTSIEKTKEGDDNGVLTFIYHQAIEEVECGNCHAKVSIYNLSSMECITDCTQHKDHECDLKLGYVRLKFSSCGDMCNECQSVILYQTCLKQTTPPKETIESSDDESEGYGYDTDSLKKADADNDDDGIEQGDWYTNRDGYQACRWCRSKGNGTDDCSCIESNKSPLTTDL